MAAALCQHGEKLLEALTEEWRSISLTVTEVDVLLQQPEHKNRADYLKYSRELTLDPNMANTHLLLSEGNKKVIVVREHQFYSLHPDRFTDSSQVLSKESLTERCYWEVELKGGGVYNGVAYRNISRVGSLTDEYGLGLNNKSWALTCYQDRYTFWHLDHSTGVLSFYSVSETMTLLRRVQTPFTQPLYAGFWFNSSGNSAEFCKLQ